MWGTAQGEGSDIITVPGEQKSISKETTFGTSMTSKELLKEKLFELTGEVCQQLRDNNWQAFTIYIKLRYSDFQTLIRSKTIKQPTADDKVIFETAWEVMEKSITRRISIRLIGVSWLLIAVPPWFTATRTLL